MASDKKPNDRLSALLIEARWSSADLARAVNALGEAEGIPLRYDRTSVAHWLSGSRPRPPVSSLIVAALSQRTGRVITVEEIGLARPITGNITADHSDEETDPVSALLQVCRRDVDPALRAALTSSTYKLIYLSPFEVRTIDPRSSNIPPNPLCRAGLITLRDTVDIVAVNAGLYGGRHGRTALAAYIADDLGRQLQNFGTGKERSAWLTGAGQLTHLLASMSDDAGYSYLAQQYFIVALRLAQEANDSGQYALTLRTMSSQALSLGHSSIAYTQADYAVSVGGKQASPDLLSYLLSQRALTYAHLGNERKALGDLHEAAAQHAKSGSTRLGPFKSYPRSGIEFQHAMVFLALKRPEQAIRYLRTSLSHRSNSQRRALALTHSSVAETLLLLGHLEAACSHWSDFLSAYPYLQSAKARRAELRMWHLLTPYRRHRATAAILDKARHTRSPSSQLWI